MADQDSIPPESGGEQLNGGAQVAVIAQYIKDLSVENPSTPQVFQWPDQPGIDVQFNINVNRLNEEMHEVILKVEVAARSERGVHFLIDLSYGGLFGLRNIPDEALGPFLLVEAPRVMFPFARQIIADASQNCGFPALLLDPIDFASAFMSQVQSQQGQQGQEAAAPGITDVFPSEIGQPDDGDDSGNGTKQ